MHAIRRTWNDTRLGGLVRLALDACFPPHCPACEAPVGAAGNLCSACYAQLRHISAPQCQRCGAPFALPLDEALCGECLRELPPYAQARAAWVYNDVSSILIKRLKFNDRTSLLPRYGQALAQAAGPLLEGVDCVIPVPLHWRRLMMRRYNQAALLAYALARHVPGLTVVPQALRRVRYTVPQTRLRGEERRRNVARAFAVRKGVALMDKTVLLLDDVMTTGATIHACTEALMKAGAKEVRVLTLARTLRE